MPVYLTTIHTAVPMHVVSRSSNGDPFFWVCETHP